MLTGGTSLMYSASSSAIRNGSGSKFFNLTNPKDGLTAASLAKIFGEQSKTAILLTSIQDKILSFFNENKGQEKTKRRQFIDDLVDGLSKSKWVGGAIMDLFKLASYFAANWLKNFGPIGKALAVGIIAAAPLIGAKMASIISTAIVKGLTNVVKTGLSGLGTLFRAAFSEKAIAGLTRGGALAGGALALAGAGALGSYAVNTWNEGGARNKWAGGLMGAGALGLGALGVSGLVAAIAPAIGAAMLAAVAPIAAPVAIIATGAGLVIKFWPQIVNFFKSVLEWLGIIADKDEDGNYISGGRTVIDSISGYGGKSERKKLPLGKHTQAWDEANTAAMKVSDTGVILNMGSLTQENLSKQISEFVGGDLMSDKGQMLKRNYDFIRADSPYVSAASFETDAITNIGGVDYVLAPKGTESRLRSTNELSKKEGILTKLSSGFGTAGRYSTLQPSSHKGNDHFRLIDAAIDLIATDMSGHGNYIDKLNKLGALKEVWGSNIKVHGEGTGLLARHAHINMSSAEGREAWDLYKDSLTGKDKEGFYNGFIESMKSSIAVKEKELSDYQKEAKSDGLSKEEKKKIKEMNDEILQAKVDLINLQEGKKRGQYLDLTGMQTVSQWTKKSKTYMDLLSQQQIN